MPRSPKIAGFSLIELMIALVIASLLATVALPAYRDHMIRGAIPQATGGLSLFAMRMEEYYQDHRTNDYIQNDALLRISFHHNTGCPAY
jgi:type IV pilus assembly protein PilE